MIDALPGSDAHVEMVLRAEGPLTQAQLAHRVYGTPVHATGDAGEDRARRTAIRNVQAAIQAMRERGVPVVSDENGVWCARTALEAMEAYRALRRRALGQLRTAAAVKRAAFAMQRAEAKVEPLTLWEAAA
ncbi:MAG: hypothetical protein JSV65_06615 [Armatimonadota bacterium]|nr:MAG: hypothetical protein JSV65_06615 [Armatimonadota bacterium]